MKYIDILNLSKVLNTFAEKKTPFSINITKNAKIVDSVVSEYNEKRQEIINEFALTDENGNFLGAVQEDGTRKTDLKTLGDLDIQDMNGLLEKLGDLDNAEIDCNIIPIDMSKSYFDTNLNEKSTVEDYISSNIEPSIIALMEKYGLITL